MLWKKSNEHMFDMIEQFKNGRTSIKTSIEIGIMLQVKTEVMD